MVGVVGEKHVGIVSVIDVSAVGAEQEDPAVGEGHAGGHREEALAVLDLLGVVDLGEVAEGAVPEVAHREIIGVVEEHRLPHVEIRTSADRAPRIDRPQIEIGAQLLAHAADRLVVDADIGLVEGRGGDVAADGQFEVWLGVELRGERIAPPERVVAHMREIHREIAAGEHRIQVVAQLFESHRALASGRAPVHLHEVADVRLRRFGQPLQLIVAEPQRRPFGTELLASLGVTFGRPAFGNAFQYLRHGRRRIGIAGVHDRHGAVEIEHVDIHGAAHRHAAPFGQVVVGVVHRQHESLIEDAAVFARRGVSRGADTAHDQIGAESHVEGPPRKVIVDATVVEQHRILLHRFENQRNGHRRTHRFAQVAVAHHHGFAGVHVARNAQERHHQAVEIALGGCRRRREKLRQRHVDRRRGEQVRHPEPLAGASHVHTHAQKRRIVPDLPVIGSIAGVDAPRNPVLDHARRNDLAHLGGRIARGVHRGDDRTHRGSGHVVDRHAVLFERFQNADMVKPLCAAAAHHDAHRTGPRSRSLRILRPGSPCAQQQHRDK